jgi:hypothetical protein
MDYDLDKLHEEILQMYRSEHEALGEQDTLELLEGGRQWKYGPCKLINDQIRRR